MSGPIHFLLNDRSACSSAPGGTPLLTVLRDEFHLTGSKPGCREGDCGACTVLIGEAGAGGIRYRNVVSCLTPLANVRGRHVVTIEGLNHAQLTPVQQAMVEHGGQQCGYCTPGFVVSLTQFALAGARGGRAAAIAAMDGNICRCTGYAGIVRAADEISTGVGPCPVGQDPLAWAVQKGFVPGWFRDVEARLAALPGGTVSGSTATGRPLAGGTDLLVGRRWASGDWRALVADLRPEPRIRNDGSTVVLAADCTGTDLLRATDLHEFLPRLPEHLKLVASTPIRNMGTVAGNLVNASPIGDYTIMLLALGAGVVLSADPGAERHVPLEEFYRAYKDLDLDPGERITEVRFPVPPSSARFNFEKVSKRTHLDIASVNSAALFDVREGTIRSARVSAGGVAPVPLFLRETSRWLQGRAFTEQTFAEAGERMQAEIAPISDVRGTARYKRLLLTKLLLAHYFELCEAFGAAA